MPSQSVLVCTAFSENESGIPVCTAQAWTETYVVSPEQQAQLDLLTMGGFDEEVFTFFFSATLLLFAIGFSVGVVISQIRKAKRGV